MKKLVFLFFCMVLLSSCATILNRTHKTVYITTIQPAKVYINHDTIETDANKIAVEVRRQSKALEFKVIKDSTTKTIKVNSINSLAYWLNAYPTPLLFTGFVIEKYNPKRYSYPTNIYVDITDTLHTYYSYDPRSRKGNIDINISYPFINNFILKPANESQPKINTGFMGFSLGFDYYYSDQQFLNLTATSILDNFAPVPVEEFYFFNYERMSSIYGSFTINYRIKRFMLGYGLSFAYNKWIQRNDDYDLNTELSSAIDKMNYALGFVFPAHYMITEYFYIGTVYRPTFYRINTPKPFCYEHSISFDFGINLHLLNRNNRKIKH